MLNTGVKPLRPTPLSKHALADITTTITTTAPLKLSRRAMRVGTRRDRPLAAHGSGRLATHPAQTCAAPSQPYPPHPPHLACSAEAEVKAALLPPAKWVPATKREAVRVVLLLLLRVARHVFTAVVPRPLLWVRQHLVRLRNVAELLLRRLLLGLRGAGWVWCAEGVGCMSG